MRETESVGLFSYVCRSLYIYTGIVHISIVSFARSLLRVHTTNVCNETFILWKETCISGKRRINSSLDYFPRPEVQETETISTSLSTSPYPRYKRERESIGLFSYIRRSLYTYTGLIAHVHRVVCPCFSSRTHTHTTTACKDTSVLWTEERWGAGVETQKNVRGEIGGWGRVPFNETYAPSLSTIYDGA